MRPACSNTACTLHNTAALSSAAGPRLNNMCMHTPIITAASQSSQPSAAMLPPFIRLQDHGFLYVHTPIITASDCEGAGEMFQVTTLLSKVDEVPEVPPPSPEELKALQDQVGS